MSTVKLTPMQRRVFALHFVQGLCQRRVAEVLRMSWAAVRMRLLRIRHSFELAGVLMPPAPICRTRSVSPLSLSGAWNRAAAQYVACPA